MYYVVRQLWKVIAMYVLNVPTHFQEGNRVRYDFQCTVAQLAHLHRATGFVDIVDSLDSWGDA